MVGVKFDFVFSYIFKYKYFLFVLICILRVEGWIILSEGIWWFRDVEVWGKRGVWEWKVRVC